MSELRITATKYHPDSDVLGLTEFSDGAKMYHAHSRPAFPYLLVLTNGEKWKVQEEYLEPSKMVKPEFYWGKGDYNHSGCYGEEKPCPWADLTAKWSEGTLGYSVPGIKMTKNEIVELAMLHGHVTSDGYLDDFAGQGMSRSAAIKAVNKK